MCLFSLVQVHYHRFVAICFQPLEPIGFFFHLYASISPTDPSALVCARPHSFTPPTFVFAPVRGCWGLFVLAGTHLLLFVLIRACWDSFALVLCSSVLAGTHLCSSMLASTHFHSFVFVRARWDPFAFVCAVRAFWDSFSRLRSFVLASTHLRLSMVAGTHFHLIPSGGLPLQFPSCGTSTAPVMFSHASVAVLMHFSRCRARAFCRCA